jgi:hypothetical protein
VTVLQVVAKQSASVWQLLPHWVAFRHLYAPQDMVAGGLQVPAPLQLLTIV